MNRENTPSETTATAVARSYRSVNEIRAANKRAGHHFFDPATIRFFRSRMGDTVYGGRYFVTSEQFNETSPRFYTIREAAPDGSVETVGEFQAYRTRAAAVNAIRALTRVAS